MILNDEEALKAKIADYRRQEQQALAHANYCAGAAAAIEKLLEESSGQDDRTPDSGN